MALCAQFSKIDNCNDIYDGSAIAIKQIVQYKMDADFEPREVKTTYRKCNYSPTNLPLSTAFLPSTYAHNSLSNNISILF